MKSRLIVALTFSLGVVIVGCSIVKREDPDQKVRNFLTGFHADLTKSDDEILINFHVKQTPEAILAATSIFQNKDPFIVCDAAFSNAAIFFEKESVKVEIPIVFRVKNLDQDDAENFTLTLFLSTKDDGYVISQFDGEGFYQAFSQIKNRNAWEAERKLALQERLPIYEHARRLEQIYDTVIWYSNYADQNYFYVVEGSWKNYFLSSDSSHNTGSKMGLADSNGKLIIPIEYDLVGALGFEENSLVEVMKDGKVGYFSIDTKQLVVPPSFDLIIPYSYDDNVWAVVKRDSTYGWLNGQFQYQPGFPSEKAEQWINDFGFLKRTIRLKPGDQSFCEIPSPDHAGNGIIIPPRYLSKNGIFHEIESSFSTTAVPLNAGTDYKEITGSFLEQITDNINAVVTSFRERYLDGREEFYASNTLVFVNKQMDTLGVARISGEGASLHPIDSALLEVRTPHDWWFMEYEACEETNLEDHSYFQIGANGEIKSLKSNRLFPQTEFVKLDSAYLTGEFIVYNNEQKKDEVTNFLSLKTITFMRDEILASYGYSFPDEELTKQFQNIMGKQYNPHYTSIEDFAGDMAEIDKHNLTFLNEIIKGMTPPI